MAGTWIPTRRKVATLRLLRLVGAPIAALARRFLIRRATAWPPRRILVIDPWHLGDVVLASAALVALRRAWPNAHLALLAKPPARELLAYSGAADEFVDVDLPWTAFTSKYRLTRYRPAAILRLVRRLRAGRFDLTVDARGDLRSDVVSFLSGAPRRAGLDNPGAFLLTHRAPPPPPHSHKVDDWMAVLRAAGVPDPRGEPTLCVTAAERTAAARTLESLGVRPDERVVGVHVGASHPVKRWGTDKFAAVADALAERHGARILVLVDPDGAGAGLPTRAPAIFVRPTLRELLALISRCELLVCNDSGPMHFAAALGVPVVAVVTSGTKEWYGPRGEGHVLVEAPGLSCRPCYNACRFAEPYCNTRVEVSTVRDAAMAQLARGAPPVGAISSD